MKDLILKSYMTDDGRLSIKRILGTLGFLIFILLSIASYVTNAQWTHYSAFTSVLNLVGNLLAMP